MNIESFSLDEKDLTANTSGTIVYDQNGDKCALIKIETIERGFSFDVGSLGITKSEYHDGEIWLYVPSGVKRLSIFHANYEKIRNYDLGLPTERARTYLLKLHVVKPSNFSAKMGSIKVTTDPQGAEVFMDGISIGRTPLSFSGIIPGNHHIAIKKEGFYDVDSDVNIVENKIANIEESMAKSCDITKLPNSIIFATKGVTFKMIKVDGGSFMMGGTSEQNIDKMDEFPVHRVTLSDYYISETEVTNELWSAIMGINPSTYFSQSDQPVNNVTWYDCQKFVNRLSSLTGFHFILPSEAQWEFAARGGNHSRKYTYSGSNNPKDVCWYKNNSKNQLKPVKQLAPNELGLYDMSGNVYEWCSDWYGLYKSETSIDPKGPENGTKKVTRGGSAGEKYVLTRNSCRSADNPNINFQGIGLRVVMLEK